MSKSDIMVGTWVRVLRNSTQAASPYEDGARLMPYDAIKVCKLHRHRDSVGNPIDQVFYMLPKSQQVHYILLKDVEKIERCICARPVLKACGCRCGHSRMVAESS